MGSNLLRFIGGNGFLIPKHKHTIFYSIVSLQIANNATHWCRKATKNTTKSEMEPQNAAEFLYQASPSFSPDIVPEAAETQKSKAMTALKLGEIVARGLFACFAFFLLLRKTFH